MDKHDQTRHQAGIFRPSSKRAIFLAAAAGASLCLTPHPALADMLTGGLLGSVLRGDDFTGPRLIDLLVIGMAIFLVLRLALGRGKNQGQDQSRPSDRTGSTDTYDVTPPPAPPRDKPNMYTNAQSAWDYLKTRPATGTTATNSQSPAPSGATPDEEFLAGAKMAYGRILGAISHRDFGDLANFTTPDFLAQLKNSLPLSPPPPPDILLVEATLASKREETSRTIMEVDYKTLVHEQDAPHNTDRFDHWRFVRDNTPPGANWLLDAMEQR